MKKDVFKRIYENFVRKVRIFGFWKKKIVSIPIPRSVKLHSRLVQPRTQDSFYPHLPAGGLSSWEEHFNISYRVHSDLLLRLSAS